MNQYDIAWAIITGLFWYDVYKDIKENSRPGACLWFLVFIIGVMIYSAIL